MKGDQIENVKRIMVAYKENQNNVRQAFYAAGLSKARTEYYMIVLPVFENMYADDAIDFYKIIQKRIIIYLASLRFSTRKISRYLGKINHININEMIKEHKRSTNAPLEVQEVEKQENG